MEISLKLKVVLGKNVGTVTFCLFYGWKLITVNIYFFYHVVSQEQVYQNNDTHNSRKYFAKTLIQLPIDHGNLMSTRIYLASQLQDYSKVKKCLYHFSLLLNQISFSAKKNQTTGFTNLIANIVFIESCSYSIRYFQTLESILHG